MNDILSKQDLAQILNCNLDEVENLVVGCNYVMVGNNKFWLKKTLIAWLYQKETGKPPDHDVRKLAGASVVKEK